MHGHVWWPRGGGDRHEATGSDRGARRAAGPVWRAGYSLPVFAGRGPKWQSRSANPFTLPALFCGFKVRVAFPVNKEYTKILKTADGSMTLLFTGTVTASFTNQQTGKTIIENIPGPGKFTIDPDGSFTEVHTGAERPPHSHASRREAVRAAYRERDRRCAEVLDREGGHRLAVPAWPCPGGRVRRPGLRLAHELNWRSR